MARHEAAAQDGELYDAGKGIPPGATESLSAVAEGKVRDLVLPIFTLVITP